VKSFSDSPISKRLKSVPIAQIYFDRLWMCDFADVVAFRLRRGEQLSHAASLIIKAATAAATTHRWAASGNHGWRSEI
jgi:hypothetical protein